MAEGIEQRTQASQHAEHRQVFAGATIKQLLRRQPMADRGDRHQRGQTLVSRGPTQADRHLPWRDDGTPHHRLASGEHSDRPGGRIGRQLLGTHTPEQVVGRGVSCIYSLLVIVVVESLTGSAYTPLRCSLPLRAQQFAHPR